MADHSVGARDELHESEASEASVFCFDNIIREFTKHDGDAEDNVD